MTKDQDRTVGDVLEQNHERLDPFRCEVCRSKTPAGCRPGDCSYRPDARGNGDPEEMRRLDERRQQLIERVGPHVRQDIERSVERAGPVTHEEARQIGTRFNASHWYPRGTTPPATVERARYSIPADPAHDDDIRLDAYIAQAEQLEAELDRVRTELLEAQHEVGEAWCKAAPTLRLAIAAKTAFLEKLLAAGGPPAPSDAELDAEMPEDELLPASLVDEALAVGMLGRAIEETGG